MLADSEARIDLLRERSGLGRERKRNGKEKEKYGVEDTTGGVNVGTSLTGQGGHINFFEDLEHVGSFFFGRYSPTNDTYRASPPLRDQ